MSTTVKLGDTLSVVTEWHSSTQMTCRTATGVSAAVSINPAVLQATAIMTIDEIAVTSPRLISYDSAGVSSVASDNLAATGASALSVCGSHYGTSAYSAGVRVGGSACEGEEWVSDSSVVCRGGAGVGGGRRVGVSAGGQWGTVTAGVSYDAGSVSSVVGDNVGASGSSEVTVSGAHYGTSAYSVGVRVGGSACESEEWASDSSVVCRAGAGVGGTRRVGVSAGGQWGTLTAGVSYDAVSYTHLRAHET